MATVYTKSVEIVEVSPRDGLQNEKVPVGTDDKLGLIAKAIDAGVRRIEVTSFVNPRAVPQMADADAVCAGLPDRDDVTYIGLVMNQRGADRALATGRIDQLGAVCVATDTFAMRNQGQTSDGSVEAAKAIIETAREAGKTAQATIAASFGCPFEGEVAEGRVIEMARAVAEAGPVEIALADTIGVGNPAHVTRLIAGVKSVVGDIPIRVHFHNTRGTGLANVWAAILAGASNIDASIGGLGGCPFAPGAAGNVATEDVQYMLERAGIETGLDLAKLIETNAWLAPIMGKQLPAMVAKSGGFPAPHNQEKELA
ncbi:hydroxymethylglutaryl-CoA lyase [Erythrobacter sp. SCSIO 43205]|uniref:hydroxymethylglutaryl-CoA lyase n=1 Tax=Erythrobacter sp. SCSIO 43205 TaxID=2779361 RepID=UPI001CA8D548|nr:hydroxymethylglutaryl-CoA lyase [Erythrobacter sp. SCSIO 43205]UAB77650.1 hydroxymethylglutaryl-CoA lyase [Erythrobacter sp. SCSIO 43205]